MPPSNDHSKDLMSQAITYVSCTNELALRSVFNSVVGVIGQTGAHDHFIDCKFAQFVVASVNKEVIFRQGGPKAAHSVAYFLIVLQRYAQCQEKALFGKGVSSSQVPYTTFWTSLRSMLGSCASLGNLYSFLPNPNSEALQLTEDAIKALVRDPTSLMTKSITFKK